MRLIDADAAIDALLKCGDYYNGNNEAKRGVAQCLGVIYELPSAQPEIIWCRDCKHQEKFWHDDKRRKDGGYYIYGCELAEGYSHVCLDDDYCSRAERRTDE